MLYRNKTGTLINLNKGDYTTDTEYYKAVMAVVFNLQQKPAVVDENHLEAMKIATLVKRQVYNSHRQ